MDVDVTILVQLALFLVVLVGLSQILLKPLLNVLETRRQRIEGARDDIERLRKLAAADMEAYQARMRKARDEAQAQRERLIQEGREQERKLLADVRAEIADMLNQARTEVGAAEQEARQRLSRDTEALAKQLVSKVLGREVAT